MRRDYEQFFDHITPPEPSVGLFGKIMAKITEEEQLLSIKRRLFLFLPVVFVSVGTFAALFNVFQEEFNRSGFTQFLSLIFSDFGSVLVNWQDFGFSLLESLPVMPIVATLTIAFIFLWALRYTIEALKSFSLPWQSLN